MTPELEAAVATWEELLAGAEADRRRRPPSPPTPQMQRLLFCYDHRVRQNGLVRDWPRLRRVLRRSRHRLGPWCLTLPHDAMVLSYHGGWTWHRTVYQQTHRGPREVGTLYGAPDRRIPPEGR